MARDQSRLFLDALNAPGLSIEDDIQVVGIDSHSPPSSLIRRDRSHNFFDNISKQMILYGQSSAGRL